MKGHPWTPEEDAIVKKHYATGGHGACLPLLERTRAAITCRAAILGVKAYAPDSDRLCPYCNIRPIIKVTCGHIRCERRRAREKVKAKTVKKIVELVCITPGCVKVFIQKHNRQTHCTPACADRHDAIKKAEYARLQREQLREGGEKASEPTKKQKPPHPCLVWCRSSEDSGERRNFDCEDYNECLDFAVERMWPNFRCEVNHAP